MLRPRLYLAHVALPLALAGGSYVLFRARDLSFFAGVDALGFAPMVDAARGAAAPVLPYLPEFLLFSAPDALWSYALVFALVRLQGGSLVALGAGLALSAGWEIGQLAQLVHGTFDPLDLVSTFAAAALAWRAAVNHQGE